MDIGEDSVADAHAGQAGKLAQGAQNDQVRRTAHEAEMAGAGKLRVCLIDCHETGRVHDDALDHLGIEAIAGRVVRVADQDQLRPLVNRVEDARRVERKVSAQRHVDDFAAVSLDEHLVHHEGRLGDDDPVARLDQHEEEGLDDVVETRAGDDRLRRCAGVAAERRAQRPGVELGVAVVRREICQRGERAGRRPIR